MIIINQDIYNGTIQLTKLQNLFGFHQSLHALFFPPQCLVLFNVSTCLFFVTCSYSQVHRIIPFIGHACNLMFKSCAYNRCKNFSSIPFSKSFIILYLYLQQILSEFLFKRFTMLSVAQVDNFKVIFDFSLSLTPHVKTIRKFY